MQVKPDTLITDGDPKEMICQAVEQTHADLAVVGSRGLSKFQRFSIFFPFGGLILCYFIRIAITDIYAIVWILAGRSWGV